VGRKLRGCIKRFALCYRIVVLSCLFVSPVCPLCAAGLLRTNGWMDQDESCRACRPRPRSSPAQRSTAPTSAHISCGQMAGFIKMPLGMEVGLSREPRRLCARRGPSLPPKKGAQPPPQFSAHVYCGQRAGCFNMALGMAVSLGPGYIVLYGTQLPSPQRRQMPPIFGPFLLSPNGWMHQAHLLPSQKGQTP